MENSINMDKKRSLLNVIVGIICKVIILFFSIYSRRILIQYVGNEANGVISLFTSIIGFLAVAELGVGSAISVCMYKPIVENDSPRVAALYNLFKKLYLIIGLIVLVGGCILIPFIPVFAKDYSLDYNLYLLFFIQLISVVITYFYSANISLANAFKNNYATAIIYTISQIFRYGVQIALLFLTKNLYYFFIVGIASELLQGTLAYFYAKKKYGEIMALNKEKVDPETLAQVKKNVYALFLHKIGAIVVNTIDSVVISTILGVVILGYYSNYITIMNALITIIGMIFQQLGSAVGHSYYKNDADTYRKYFFFFYFTNYAVGSFAFLGYFACISPFINFFFGEGLLLSDASLFVIVANYFIQFMENAVRLFKDSSGLFYQDRYKSIVESVINLGLSIAFAYWIGLVGVIVATIITNIFISHTVEPHVLYKYAFKRKEYKYLIINYSLISIFIGLLFAYYFLNQLSFDNYLLQFLINGLIAVSFSIPSFILLYIYTKKNFHVIDRFKAKLFHRRNA